jgi:ParB family chromosome partitioning protein
MTSDRKRQALGRGLGALIPTDDRPSGSEDLVMAPISEVFPNPGQPRRNFDEGALSELTASIREKGILQPVLATRVPGGFEIVAGERRFRAAKQAGLKEVPLLIKQLDDAEKLELALIENIQRENLNPIEEAQAYRKLQKSYSYTQEEVARKVGKDRATVANALRLLTLPDFARGALAEGKISAGHARALLTVKGEAAVRKLLKKIISAGISVREAERLAAGAKSPGPAARRRVTPEAADLEKKLERHLGGKVKLSEGKKGGKLEIRYKDLAQLNDIVEKILK